MKKEGVIKFDCRWTRADLSSKVYICRMNLWRERLCRMKFIGLYPNGYGYGNLSVRFGHGKKFVITGSQTEGIAKLRRCHYTVVTDYLIDENRVCCRGPIQASSELLTHAMIYEIAPSVKAVIHVHHPLMWKNLLGKAPTTSAQSAYGTPSMARNVGRLFRNTGLAKTGLFVMGGHKDGIVVFGANLGSSFHILMHYFKHLQG